MKTFNLCQIVSMMTGNINPAGDSAIDKERFINLVDQLDLLKMLFENVYEVYLLNKDSHEESCKRSAEKARDTLKEIIDFYSIELK